MSREQDNVDPMSREQDNKAIVGRWFEGFWGNPWNPEIIDELAAPDMLLEYSLHAPPWSRGCAQFHGAVPCGVPGPQFLGRGRPNRRG